MTSSFFGDMGEAGEDMCGDLTTTQIGDRNSERGIYFGPWEAAPGHTVHAYAADDFLRNWRGKQLLLPFNKAVKKFVKSNAGRAYGDGTERALREAIKSGSYREGDLVLPPRELLHGGDAYGHTIRPRQNIFELIKAGNLPKIAAAIEPANPHGHWAMSSSEHPDHTPSVAHVRLTDRCTAYGPKHIDAAAIIPMRLYRSSANGS